MTHYNLTQVNFPSQAKPFAPPTPSLPIKKEEGNGGISPLTSHQEWKEKFLGEGETISIPLRREGGGMLKIPRVEIVKCMEKLYQRRVLANPNESQWGIYEEAKKIVVSRYLKKEGLVKNKKTIMG